MNTGNAMGGHQSARPISTTWLTPPTLIADLGGADSFALDPCGFEASPIRTARDQIALPADGLAVEWDGRVWLNPPYTSGEVDGWLSKLAQHGRGTALIFARTETACFAREVWGKASGLLFLFGRLHFHNPDGEDFARCGASGRESGLHEFADKPHPMAGLCRWCGVSKANAGAPSVLCAYGADDLDRLAASPLPGSLVPLRFARGVMVAALEPTWGDAVLAFVRRQGGAVSVSDLYRHFARHPKARGRANWRAKVRQTVQRLRLDNVGPGLWAEGVAA